MTALLDHRRPVASGFAAAGNFAAHLIVLQALWLIGLIRGGVVFGWGPANRALFAVAQQNSLVLWPGLRFVSGEYWGAYGESRRHWAGVGAVHLLHGILVAGAVTLGALHLPGLAPLWLGLAIYGVINGVFAWYVASRRRVLVHEILYVPFFWGIANIVTLVGALLALGLLGVLYMMVLPLGLLIGASSAAVGVTYLAKTARLLL